MFVLRTFIQKNKKFSIIVGIQIAVLIYLIIGLFLPRYVVNIQLENEGGSSYAYPIRSGAYKVNVEYFSQKSIDNPSYSLNDSTASIIFESKSNLSSVRMNDIVLDDGHNVAYGRLWIAFGSRLKDFKMRLNYSGEGELLIKSVELREQIKYRYIRIAAFILAFGVLNSIYIILWARGIELHQDKWEIIRGGGYYNFDCGYFQHAAFCGFYFPGTGT